MFVLKILVVTIFVILGCVTADDPSQPLEDGLEITERSRAEPPAWLHHGDSSFTAHDGDQVFRFVQKATKLKDLALGIKRTQNDGLKNSRKEIAKLITQQIGERAQNFNRVSESTRNHIVTIAEESATKIHSESASVADIYFERIRDPDSSDEYYRAFVLIEFPKEGFTRIHRALAARLLNSGDSDARRIGETLNSSESLEITH